MGTGTTVWVRIRVRKEGPAVGPGLARQGGDRLPTAQISTGVGSGVEENHCPVAYHDTAREILHDIRIYVKCRVAC